MHSHLQRKKTHTHLPLTGHFLFFGPSCLNRRGGPHGKIHSDARLELQQTPSFRSWPLRAPCPKSARKQSSRRSRSREPVIRPNYQREMKRDLEPIFRFSDCANLFFHLSWYPSCFMMSGKMSARCGNIRRHQMWPQLTSHVSEVSTASEFTPQRRFHIPLSAANAGTTSSGRQEFRKFYHIYSISIQLLECDTSK